MMLSVHQDEIDVKYFTLSLKKAFTLARMRMLDAGQTKQKTRKVTLHSAPTKDPDVSL